MRFAGLIEAPAKFSSTGVSASVTEDKTSSPKKRALSLFASAVKVLFESRFTSLREKVFARSIETPSKPSTSESPAGAGKYFNHACPKARSFRRSKSSRPSVTDFLFRSNSFASKDTPGDAPPIVAVTGMSASLYFGVQSSARAVKFAQ